MFCLHVLSTHKSTHPENPTSIGRHRKVHLDILSFIRHLLFIKWEHFEIDVQELFWASIFNVLKSSQHLYEKTIVDLNQVALLN